MALNEEQIKLWQGRIELAKHHQEKFGNQSLAGTNGGRWDTYVRALASDYGSRSDLGEEAIDVNMARSTAKTALPPLWLQEPHIVVKPRQSRVTVGGKDIDNIHNAEVAEVELNYWMRELRVREMTMRPMILDAHTTNHGYAYIGYIKDKQEVENEDGEVVEPIPTIRLKQPFVRRLAPKQILVPPGKWHLEECEWVAILWLKRQEDVEKRYGVTDIKGTVGIMGDHDESNISDSLRAFLDSDDAKLVEVQQIWDKRSKRLITLAAGNDEVLEEADWPAEFEGFPLVDLTFEDIPDDYYGTPPMQYSFPQYKELNAARTFMRKRFNRNKGVKLASGEITDEVKEAYQNAKDGDMITTGLSGEQPLQNHIMDDPGVPPDMVSLQYDATIKQDIREIDGFSAEQRGGGDPNVETATQSANIEKHVQVRSSDRGDRVRLAYVEIARKLRMVLLQFPNEKRERMVAGAIAGQFTNIEYTLAELRGEFEFSMDMSATLLENPATRQAQALANYNLFRADPLVQPEQLVLDVLRSQNKPNPEQYLLKLRTPDEEFQMMMQGLPVEPHERDNHEVHLQEHEAQAAQLEAALDQVQQQDPESDVAMKIQVAGALMMAHINSTMRVVQQITGQAGRQAGQPIGENMFRNQQTVMGGSETAAEVGGQPLAQLQP